MSRLGKSRIHAIVPADVRVAELAGIGTGTPVLTLDGELPVEHLTAGDRVITRAGARVLRRITAHVTQGGYRVRPAALGDGRPEAETVLGPAQKVHLRDWRAKALYGAATADAPVGALADGEYILPTTGAVRIWRLEFDEAQVIYAGGLEIAVPAPEPADI